jgi:hypothetical protein
MKGEEVVHLPVIVESVESSPAAASKAAYTIRKFLSKDNISKPHVQYNAFMLVRILSDNPGPMFTRNLDAKFTQAVKDLLRSVNDPSVQQIIRETLDTFEREKATDENLKLLIDMWIAEKKKQEIAIAKYSGVRNGAPVPAAPVAPSIPSSNGDSTHRAVREWLKKSQVAPLLFAARY